MKTADVKFDIEIKYRFGSSPQLLLYKVLELMTQYLLFNGIITIIIIRIKVMTYQLKLYQYPNGIWDYLKSI